MQFETIHILRSLQSWQLYGAQLRTTNFTLHKRKSQAKQTNAQAIYQNVGASEHSIECIGKNTKLNMATHCAKKTKKLTIAL